MRFNVLRVLRRILLACPVQPGTAKRSDWKRGREDSGAASSLRRENYTQFVDSMSTFLTQDIRGGSQHSSRRWVRGARFRFRQMCGSAKGTSLDSIPRCRSEWLSRVAYHGGAEVATGAAWEVAIRRPTRAWTDASRKQRIPEQQGATIDGWVEEGCTGSDANQNGGWRQDGHEDR